MNVIKTMVTVVARYAPTLKETIIVDHECTCISRALYNIIQISLNVMTTMVAVVRYAPTLNVPVERAMY